MKKPLLSLLREISNEIPELKKDPESWRKFLELFIEKKPSSTMRPEFKEGLHKKLQGAIEQKNRNRTGAFFSWTKGLMSLILGFTVFVLMAIPKGSAPLPPPQTPDEKSTTEEELTPSPSLETTPSLIQNKITPALPSLDPIHTPSSSPSFTPSYRGTNSNLSLPLEEEPLPTSSSAPTPPSSEPTTSTVPLETDPSSEPTTSTVPLETDPSSEPTTSTVPLETDPSSEPTTSTPTSTSNFSFQPSLRSTNSLLASRILNLARTFMVEQGLDLNAFGSPLLLSSLTSPTLAQEALVLFPSLSRAASDRLVRVNLSQGTVTFESFAP